MKTDILKEISYCGEHIKEVAAHGTYNGYEFYVIDLGTHPCAYIVIDENHKILEGIKHEWDVPVECHGGITWQGRSDDRMEGKYAIGWDYAHAGDCYASKSFQFFAGWEVKHYIDEILSHVKDVINQIVEFDNNHKTE